MNSISSMRLARVALSLAVALWMAGAGCMLGCENTVSAAAPSVPTTPATGLAAVVSGDACASVQSHDCCAKHRAKSVHKTANRSEADSKAILLESTPASMMDCPLAVNATAVLSKARPDYSPHAVLAATSIDTVVQTPFQGSALLHPLRLPNRGHTYLSCCVFLI